MAAKSAGLLMYRHIKSELEFFLIHPGGPFYKKKNDGVWSIPKGIPDEGEDLLLAAQREFQEETGILAVAPFIDLGSCKTKSGKTIYAWAFKGEWDESQGIVSNMFLLEWPPRSGKNIEVPEADMARWFNYGDASKAVSPQQLPFLDRLIGFHRINSSQ
jgi:predicted NUDIX family NTP pyrophosphohydrolase